MNDKSIREILISWLQATNHEIRIYQEKSIGASICDVMAVTDKLTGYEIKSDQDNYARLQDQVKAYAESLLQQQNSGRPPNVFLGVTRLLHHMGSIFQENSLPQSNPGGIQIDRKRLEQLQEKREAHGLKGNVYEEYKGPTMSM